MTMIQIRNTERTDEPAIRQVHEAAFGPKEGQTIADLTIALLHDPTAEPLISLLACDGSTAIGHVLFTSVRISVPEKPPIAHILAPLAVLPDYQRQGTGTQVVQRGMELLAESGCELVFVLGHPEYYPRFGFRPAGRLGFSAPYPIPEKDADAWMVLELCPGMIGNVSGTIHCAEALNKPEYWRE
jgi:putative acetyltransferase